jgi:glycosyltransferase involved in cell wall biosynthesis
LKVLQVLNHFLPRQVAGTEVYTWALSRHLQQKGIDVEVVIPHYGQHISDSYEYNGLKVFQYAEPSIVNRSLIMGFREPDGLAVFNKYLDEQKPDIVHFHEVAGSNGITLRHIISAKNKGAKVLMTFHLAGYSCKTGTLIYKEQEFCDGAIDIQKCSTCYLQSKGVNPVNSLLRPISLLFYKLGINTTSWNNKLGTALATSFVIENLQNNFNILVNQCDQIVVLTEWYKKILILNGVSEQIISHVSQGLPFSPIRKSIIDNGSSMNRLRLMFLGRISAYKGLGLLLEVLLGLPSDKVELDIYGHSEDDAYEKVWRGKTFGFENIRWKGEVKQQDVLNIMEQHDVLCLCSTFSEMSPLVIQEAFAAGIPVLASNVYGNAEQVKDGTNGWLFKFNDGNDLNQKLKKLIDNPHLIEEAKRYIPVVSDFSLVTDEYIKLYKKLIKPSLNVI